MQEFNREVAKQLGDLLRRAREEKDVPIEKVEAATFISERFLRALEEGRWEELPGKAYALGYTKIYARFLGLRQEEVVDLFLEAYGEGEKRNRPRETRRPVEAHSLRPPRKRRKTVLLAILFSLVALCGVLIVFFFAPFHPFVTENPGKNEEVLLADDLASPLPPESPPPSFPVVLRLVAEKVTWVDITSLGVTMFSGILVPGKTYVFRSEGPVEVSGDDGSAVQVWLNGEEKGYLAETPGPFHKTFVP
ncbi:RodZ domain-containing protein [Candidatus Caldatribacterium saccharofermentans]|uniref:helix-turn-helix domain-containing protein n=1 Tax=Candidatus Caldatribacterium saccharofermentans TaxID=1454753 RepID=UPI003CFC91AE